MVKKPSLGTPLDSLLSSVLLEPETVQKAQLKYLPVEQCQRSPYQPRKEFKPEALAELAQSIRTQGVIQPIVVRQIGPESYEIIAGERRWRAAQQAELTEIPAVIRDVSDEAALAMALIENLQREDLNPLEEALALNRLMNEFGLTHQEAADVVGKSRTAVTNLLRLLTLRSEVKTMLEQGDLEMGHARALLALKGNAQIKVAHIIVAKDLSVRQTEKIVRQMLQNEEFVNKTIQSMDPDIKNLETKLSEKFGTAVAIAHSRAGHGKLVFRYNSLEELDGILEKMG
ncbi:MAG: ParB/RepB/Spo0J family partition protein [Gammaproteobacteria bacterium]|jgi:ParB family chromosome partitioning protein